MLFFWGENEFNVPLPNTEQMYQALRSLCVPPSCAVISNWVPDQFALDEAICPEWS